MKNNEQDRRTLKTQQAIHEALLSLMMEKQYNRITIQDIIDRANVGRSTFYSHYATKDELLISSIEQMLEMMNEHIINHQAKDGEKHRLIPVDELFEHIKENSHLIKALIKGKSVDLFIEKVQDYWDNKIAAYLNSQLPKGQKAAVPISILTSYISSTLIFLLKWWVDNKMAYSSSQMDRYFHELVNPSIYHIMNGKSSIGC